MTIFSPVFFGILPGLPLIFLLFEPINERSTQRWVGIQILGLSSFGVMMAGLPSITGQLDIYLTSLLVTYTILNLVFWCRRNKPPTLHILLA